MSCARPGYEVLLPFRQYAPAVLQAVTRRHVKVDDALSRLAAKAYAKKSIELMLQLVSHIII